MPYGSINTEFKFDQGYEIKFTDVISTYGGEIEGSIRVTLDGVEWPGDAASLEAHADTVVQSVIDALDALPGVAVLDSRKNYRAYRPISVTP